MDVSVAEAKNQLSQLVRAVESGEEVVITRNGRPVAQLVPAPQGSPGHDAREDSVSSRVGCAG
jgi:prevent-host-death family protein